MASIFKRNGRGPWLISYFDHAGKRRERSSRTTVKAAAERIAAKLEADVALRRDGVIDPKQDSLGSASRVTLADHAKAYIDYCTNGGESPVSVSGKRHDIERFAEDSGASRLHEVTAERLAKHMSKMRREGMKPTKVRRLRRHHGLSAATVNNIRKNLIAFMSWCVKTDRIAANPLLTVPKQDERSAHRRPRRPYTDEELARLLAVAERRGRKAWYMVAALAGLRRGDTKRLTWADIDFNAGVIVIRKGKSGRADETIPMHTQLADELKALRDGSMALPAAKVFPASDTRTWQRDLLDAGLARLEPVKDADGKPVMRKVKRRVEKKWTELDEPVMRIVTADAEGMVLDFHALRKTLGTWLARHGVAPQLAQRIMRHGDYRTTLKHYTALNLVDTTAAMNRLPGVAKTALAATGTDQHSASPPADSPAVGVGNSSRIKGNGASKSPVAGPLPAGSANRSASVSCENKGQFASMDGTVRDDRTKAGDENRTRNIQLGKVSVAQSQAIASDDALASCVLPSDAPCPSTQQIPQQSELDAIEAEIERLTRRRDSLARAATVPTR